MFARGKEREYVNIHSHTHACARDRYKYVCVSEHICVCKRTSIHV